EPARDRPVSQRPRPASGPSSRAARQLPAGDGAGWRSFQNARSAIVRSLSLVNAWSGRSIPYATSVTCSSVQVPAGTFFIVTWKGVGTPETRDTLSKVSTLNAIPDGL